MASAHSTKLSGRVQNIFGKLGSGVKLFPLPLPPIACDRIELIEVIDCIGSFDMLPERIHITERANQPVLIVVTLAPFDWNLG